MQIKDYIKGNRQGKEANRLEREAMNDPFLQGALDGFDSVAGNHAEIIEQLEEKYAHPTVVLQSKKRKFFYWAAAASILLLIGFGAYFLLEENYHDQKYSSLAEEINPSTPQSFNPSVPQSAGSSMPKLEAASKPEPLLAEKTVKKVVPAANPAITPVMKESIRSSSVNNVAVMDTHSISSDEKPDEAPLIAEVIGKDNGKTIHGKIVDETGEPLVGVSIVEKGTQNGTVTNTDGTFALQLPTGDSSKLIASYLGYERQEINPSVMDQTVALKQDNAALNEVVVIGYGTQKKSIMTGSVSSVSNRRVAGASANNDKSIQSENAFGEKEFQTWCRQKAGKNVCDGNGATVKVSFFIDENGKPSKIEYRKYSCEEAKEEMENLLSTSPVWTTTNRKVTMMVKW